MVSIRIPDVLQAMIDSAAGEGKRSEWILKACRMRLNGVAGKDSGNCIGITDAAQDAVEMGQGHHATHRNDVKSPAAAKEPQTPPTPDMQALRDICAGKIEDPCKMTDSQYEEYIYGPDRAKWPTTEIPICGKQWWEDGEHYECLMDAGHREQKHGMRGMVRRID